MTLLLPVSFFILKYIGLWQPVQWIGWKKHMYTVFTIFSITILYTDTGCQIVEAIETSVTVSDYATHTFILLTMIGICIKMGSIIKNRKEIINLINILQNDSFQIRNLEEEKVLKVFEYIMKWRTILFFIFVQMGTMNLIVRSLIYLAPHRITITKLYVPWNSKTFIGFWTAWSLQAISRWFGGPVNVALDSLVSGIMYRAAVQFKILQIRLKNLIKSNETCENNIKQLETKIISELVEAHIQIIQIISKLNDLFGFLMFIQYCISSSVLGVTVFVFAQIKQFDGYAAMMITYTGCLYFQVYLLCSAGSEMTTQGIKFASYIYASDWEQLELSSKKSLLLMMMISHKPIKFTSFNIIELSIESFSQIVKFSYSAYNILAHG